MNATEFCENDDQLMLVVGVLLDTELQDGAGQGEEQEGPRVVSFLEILQARNFRHKMQTVGKQYTDLAGQPNVFGLQGKMAAEVLGL